MKKEQAKKALKLYRRAKGYADGGEAEAMLDVGEVTAPPINPEAMYVSQPEEGRITRGKRALGDLPAPPQEAGENPAWGVTKELLATGAAAAGGAFGGPAGAAVAGGLSRLLLSLFAEGGMVITRDAGNMDMSGQFPSVTLGNDQVNRDSVNVIKPQTMAEGGEVDGSGGESDSLFGKVGPFGKADGKLGSAIDYIAKHGADLGNTLPREPNPVEVPFSPTPGDSEKFLVEDAATLARRAEADKKKEEERSLLDSLGRRLEATYDRSLQLLGFRDDNARELVKTIAGKSFKPLEGEELKAENKKREAAKLPPLKEGEPAPIERKAGRGSPIASIIVPARVEEFNKQFPGRGEEAAKAYAASRTTAIEEFGGLTNDKVLNSRIEAAADRAAEVSTALYMTGKIALERGQQASQFAQQMGTEAGAGIPTAAAAPALPAPSTASTGASPPVSVPAPAPVAPASVPTPSVDSLMGTLKTEVADITAPTTIDAPAAGQSTLSRTDDADKLVLTALETPELRYASGTVNALRARTGRYDMVYKLALASGYKKDEANRIAVDQAALELTAPNLPTLKSGAEYIEEARQSPEVRRLTRAQEVESVARMAQADLNNKERELTYDLRALQDTLELKATTETERRLAANTAMQDRIAADVLRDRQLLGRMISDSRTKSSLDALGATISVFSRLAGYSGESLADWSRKRVADEIDTQIAVVGSGKNLIDSYVAQGNSIQAAAKLTEAQLKKIFAIQLRQAAGKIPDKAAAYKAIEAAAKLDADAASDALKAIKDDVDMRIDPFKIRAQGAAGQVKDAFDWVRARSDLRQKEMDIGIRREELASKEEDRKLQRDLKKMDSEVADIYGKFASGQSVDMGQWGRMQTEFMRMGKGEYLAGLTVKPFKKVIKKFENADGTVTEVETYVPDFGRAVLAKDEASRKEIDTFDDGFGKFQKELDNLEGIAAKYSYSKQPNLMEPEDKAAWVNSSGFLTRALAGPSQLGMGTPQDAETKFLKTLVPDMEAFTRDGFTRSQFKTLRERANGGLLDMRNRRTIGGAEPISAAAPRTVKVYDKTRKIEVEASEAQAREILGGKDGANFEVR